MKRFFKIGISVLVLTLVFAACDTPTSFKNANTSTNTNVNTNPLETLEAPANVTATVFPGVGVVRVSWTPVANATAYSVYRTSKTMGTVFLSSAFRGDYTAGPPLTNLVYDDVISFKNEFKVGESYTYHVIAYSGLSTNIANQSYPLGVPSDQWQVLQNSSAVSSAVSFTAANLIARNGELGAPANLDVIPEIKTTIVAGTTYTKTELLRATWDAQPSLTYVVSYSYAGDEVEGLAGNYLRQIDGAVVGNQPGSLDGAANFSIPLIFANATVEVIAQKPVITGETLSYYRESKPVTKTVALERQLLDKPVAFTVTRKGFFDVLEWTKMDDAASYKVFQLEYDNTAFTSGGRAMYNNWKDISAEGFAYTDLGTTQTIGLNTYKNLGGKFKTTTTNNNSTYQYILVAINGDKMSLPIAATPIANNYTAPNITTSNLNWDTINEGWKGVGITWTPVTGEFYRLYRAQLTYDYANGNTNAGQLVSVGEWENIDIGSLGTSADVTPVAFNDKPGTRKSWRYQLRSYATAEDAVAGAANPQNDDLFLDASNGPNDINSYPYKDNFVRVNLMTGAFPTHYPTTTAPDTRVAAYGHQYGLNGGKTQALQLKSLLLDTEVVQFYRTAAIWDGSTYRAVEGAPRTKVSSIAKSAISDEGNYFTVEGTGPVSYIYTADIVDAAGGVVAYADTIVSPAFAQKSISAEDSSATAGTLTLDFEDTTPSKGSLRYKESGNEEKVTGTKVYIRYATSTNSVAEARTKITNNSSEVMWNLDLTLNKLTGSTSPLEYTTGDFLNIPATISGFTGNVYYAIDYYIVPGNYSPQYTTIVWSQLSDVKNY